MTYTKLHRRFLNLTEREKSLILLTGIVAIVVIGYLYFIEPLQKKITEQQGAIRKVTQQQYETENNIQRLMQQQAIDPNEQLLRQKNQLQTMLKRLNGNLNQQTQDLIPATKMPAALQQMLAEASGVKVISFESIPAQRLTEDGRPNNTQNSNKQDSLYQHGLIMQLEGDFFSIQNYLEAIEQLPWRFYWQSFDYKVTEYPTAEVEISLFTLSTSEAFIGV